MEKKASHLNIFYLFLGAKLLNWISPTTKVASIQFENISRNHEANEKKKKLFAEYGDNGGMMAFAAVHMMAVQEKIMVDLHEIQVQTLICAGTDDKMISIRGIIQNKIEIYRIYFSNRIRSQSNSKQRIEIL